MIKSILSITAALLLISCASESSKNSAELNNQASSSATTLSKDMAQEAKGLKGISACDLLSQVTLSSVLPSDSGYKKEGDTDENGKRASCKYALEEGFGMMNWALNYNEKGWGNNDSRFEKINTYEKVEIDAADGAYYNSVQHKLEAWKGNYSLTLIGPITKESMSNSVGIQKNSMAVASEIFRNL